MKRRLSIALGSGKVCGRLFYFSLQFEGHRNLVKSSVVSKFNFWSAPMGLWLSLGRSR